MEIERTYTIKQTAEQTGISEDTIRYYERIALLQQVVDFIDLKLGEGRILRDCSEDSSEGVPANRRGERKPKPASPVEMSYFPPARLFGGQQANEAAGDSR